MDHAADELQGDVESIAACELLPWPDCGRTSNMFAAQGGHATLTLLLGCTTKLSQVHLGQQQKFMFILRGLFPRDLEDLWLTPS